MHQSVSFYHWFDCRLKHADRSRLASELAEMRLAHRRNPEDDSEKDIDVNSVKVKALLEFVQVGSWEGEGRCLGGRGGGEYTCPTWTALAIVLCTNSCVAL